MAQTTRTIRGATLMDTLIGALIMVVAVFGMVNLVKMLLNITEHNQRTTVAYTLAKSTIEAVRNQGFPRYPDGSSTLYYDAYGALVGSLPGKTTSYKVVTSVSSSAYATGSVVAPANTSIRTVKVQVKSYPLNSELLTSGTYLVRGGI